MKEKETQIKRIKAMEGRFDEAVAAVICRKLLEEKKTKFEKNNGVCRNWPTPLFLPRVDSIGLNGRENQNAISI